jgi:hypothetical protein
MKKTDTVKDYAKQNQTDIQAVESADKNLQNIDMSRSRLHKTIEKQSKKMFIFSTLGLIIIILLIVIFGQTLLVDFSVILASLKSGSTQNSNAQEQSTVYIASPFLDPQPDATNSAAINVSGAQSSNPSVQIKLYVNNELIDVTKTKINNTFEFIDVKLKEGQNNIKAIASIQNNNSANSNIVTINYIKKEPNLSIDSPQNGDLYSGENNTALIKGKTDPGVLIKVNDFLAITKSDGNYSTILSLHNGENNIKVAAVDEAGNITEKDLKVTYSP